MQLNKTLIYGDSNCEECHYNYFNQRIPYHVEDCLNIQRTAFEHGFDISLADAQELWEDFSENYSAGWLIWNFKDTWEQIKIYFMEIDS